MGSSRAKEKISGNARKEPRIDPSNPLSSPASLHAPFPLLNRSRLLNRVVSFYHQSFCEDRRGAEYLKTQGISDREIFSDFKVGFGNGTLLNAVPGEGEVWEALKEIGILNTEGQEVFYGCVVFPIFDENHDCVDHYGRKIM